MAAERSVSPLSFITFSSSVAFCSVLPLPPSFQGCPLKSRNNGATKTLGSRSVKALYLTLLVQFKRCYNLRNDSLYASKGDMNLVMNVWTLQIDITSAMMVYMFQCSIAFVMTVCTPGCYNLKGSFALGANYIPSLVKD